MKYMNAFLSAALLFSGRVPGEVLPPPGGPRDYSALPADPTAAAVIERRLELEFRRAGGPRRDVVADLLRVGERTTDLDWGQFVIRACQERLIDCSDFVSVAVQRAKEARPDLRLWAESRVKGIRQEAAIQALSPKVRQDLYAKALRQGDARQGDVRVVAGDAVWRATREGMVTLVTSKDAVAAHKLAETRPVLRAELDVAQALSSQDPARALLDLVARGVAHEMTMPQVSDASGSADQAGEAGARVALKELRRLNPAGAAGELKRTLTAATASRAVHASTKSGSQGAPSLGNLTLNAAEVVGDLGDREFERRMLGGRTLWDQVNEVEEVLAKSGKIPRSAMVASASQ